MRQMLVTGAGGMLGSALVEVARNSAWGVVPVYRHKAPQTHRGIGVDLADEAAMDALSSVRPDLVVNCAALTDVEWCESHQEEARLVNAEVPGRIAQMTADLRVPMVQISTDSVFDGKRGAYAEVDIPRPLNFYASTKLAAESLVLAASDRHLVIRTNIFGWTSARSSRLGLASWVLARLSEGERVGGFVDARFTPLHVNDLSAVIIEMAEASLSGLFHAGSADPVSKFDFAVMLAEAFDFDRSLIEPTVMAEVTFSASRPMDTSLDSGELARRLGPLPPVSEGIQHLKRSPANPWR